MHGIRRITRSVAVSLLAAAGMPTARAAGQTAAAAARPLRLDGVGLSVLPPDHTTWSSSLQLTNGQRVDRLTGTSAEGSFVMVMTTSTQYTCSYAMGGIRMVAGSQLVTDPPYAPATLAPVVMNQITASFCMTLPGRIAIVGLRPATMSAAQQASARLMVQTIYDAATGARFPVGSAELDLTAPLELSQLAITVPVDPDRGWVAGTTDGPNGTRLDEITIAARRVAVTVTRSADAVSCPVAIDAARAGTALSTSDDITTHWVVGSRKARGKLVACLKLSSGVLLASWQPSDERGVQSTVWMLQHGLRLAAFQRWGAPPEGTY